MFKYRENPVRALLHTLLLLSLVTSQSLVAIEAQASETKTWENYYNQSSELIIEFAYAGNSSDVYPPLNGISGTHKVEVFSDDFETVGSTDAPLRTDELRPDKKFFQLTSGMDSQDKVFIVISPDSEDAEITGFAANSNTGYWYNNVLGIRSWGDYGFTSVRSAFVDDREEISAGKSSVAVPGEIPAGVTDLSFMFRDKTAFNDPNVLLWDTSNVTNFNSMFENARAFNQNLSVWKTDAAQSMNSMFLDAVSFDQNLNTWDISKLQSFTSIFQDSGLSFENHERFLELATNSELEIRDKNFNLLTGYDLSGRDKTWTNFYKDRKEIIIELEVSTKDGGLSITLPLLNLTAGSADLYKSDYSVHGTPTQVGDQFDLAESLEIIAPASKGGGPFANGDTAYLVLSELDFGRGGFFGVDEEAEEEDDFFIGGLSSFSFPGFTKTMSKSGGGSMPVSWSSQLKGILAWDVNLTALNDVFIGSDITSVPNSLPDSVSKLTSLFEGQQNFNQDISGWNLSRITDTSSMFKGATSFNQDVSSWKTSAVTNMSSMFEGATAFNQDISGWDMSLVSDTSSMFKGATSFNQDISSWRTTAVTNMSSMFQDATAFNQNLSEWSVSQVTNMSFMFNGATSYNQPVAQWDTSLVTTMSGMFQQATSFNQDLRGFNFKKLDPSQSPLNNFLESADGMSCENSNHFWTAVQLEDTGLRLLPENERTELAKIDYPRISVREGRNVEQLTGALAEIGWIVDVTVSQCYELPRLADSEIEAEADENINFSFKNDGGFGQSFSIDPELPSGLSITSSGQIIGSVSSGYNRSHTFTATNEAGSATATVSIQITGSNPPPAPATAPPTSIPSFTPAPTVSQVMPVIELPEGGVMTAKPGTEVKITGKDLDEILEVTIDSEKLEIITQTETELVLLLPEMASGEYSLRFSMENDEIVMDGFLRVTEPVAPEKLIQGLSKFSSWLNRDALDVIQAWDPEVEDEVVCIAYNDRPGISPRKKAVSRAEHACRDLSQRGFQTRIFVYGKAPTMADKVKLLAR